MRQLLILLCLLLIFNGCRDDAAQPPNIVFILADDLGYNDLSCYRKLTPQTSQKPPTALTPNIDQLAGSGMMFTNFYCGAAVCSPSRAALMTGRNATRVGIYNYIPPNSVMHLRDSEITIAELLKAKDYRTGHFGKWHLSSEGRDHPQPREQGFDHAFFTYNNAEPSHHNPVNFIRNGEKLGELEGYSCQLVVDEAIKWLRDADDGMPFYMNVWYNEPHEKVAAPDTFTKDHTYNEAYYGCIENMDDATGRLLAYLEQRGLMDNTIVMFSSDNGSKFSGSNDPFRGEKCFNYEGGVRVPFIIKWPGHIEENAMSEAVGNFTDIFPTVAKLTQCEVPADRAYDGEDISRVFLGKAESFERNTPVFFYRYFHDPVCMLREGKWILLGYEDPPVYRDDYDAYKASKIKPDEDEPAWSMWRFQPRHSTYIQNQEVQYFELYDIEKDPEQKHNLSSQYPERVKNMKATMLQQRIEMLNEGGDWY